MIDWRRLLHSVRRLLLVLAMLAILAASSIVSPSPAEEYRRFTRAREFDFLGWTVDALVVKLQQASVGNGRYLSEAQRSALVLDYLDLLRQAQEFDRELSAIYSDPSISNPQLAAAETSAALAEIRARSDTLQPVVESILEEQVGVLLEELGLGFAGVPLPPVSFHLTRVPVALILSPRSVIEQIANIQLEANLTLEEKLALEAQVEQDGATSALIEPIGGIGTYPTMIQETRALVWLVETIVHEWVHNYLVFRPLGWKYTQSPEMRTINETVASILGREIGRQVIARYYPEQLPPPPAPEKAPETPTPAEEPVFSFRATMRETRVTVDAMLAEGRIEEAEAYMEAQRQLLWEHGYRIRRLNQAYFAFHGAYAASPGGAAGTDPVGEAVRALWERLQAPQEFLQIVSRIGSFDDLQAILDG